MSSWDKENLKLYLWELWTSLFNSPRALRPPWSHIYRSCHFFIMLLNTTFYCSESPSILFFWVFFCPFGKLCSAISYSVNSPEGGLNQISCMLTVLFYSIFLYYLVLMPSCFKKICWFWWYSLLANFSFPTHMMSKIFSTQILRETLKCSRNKAITKYHLGSLITTQRAVLSPQSTAIWDCLE